MAAQRKNQALEFITIQRCSEHNLKDISLRIPLKKLTLICGVSGSGKSTLAYDVLFREGQGRFLESFSAYARIFGARSSRPRLDAVANIPPALALGQRLPLNNPRSTVATLTDLLTPVRMLFSRFAHSAGERLTRSHLSFNHPLGACPHCQGLGQIHEIDLDKLIADGSCSLRQGALSLTTPSGYIIYSQVTMEVLDQVCRAHGFTVDIAWNQLTDEQKRIVLYGSDRITIPFGKHPLESRLKWSGITPKPRELGIYRGIAPIMEEILHRDPNPNILRFCSQRPCQSCGGLRLNARFLDVTYRQTSLRQLLSFTVLQLADWGEREAARHDLSRPEKLLLSGMTEHARLLCGLSLGHLSLHRAVPTLSRSEGQRIQIGNLLKNPISGMLYLLDEPGSGLHPFEKRNLYRQFLRLTGIGSTVVMVSHDRQALSFADWVVELGPVGGEKGGHLLFCDSAERYRAALADPGAETPTLSAWRRRPETAGVSVPPGPPRLLFGPIKGNALDIDNLKLPSSAVTAVSGLSGSGKTSLLDCIAEKDPSEIHGEPAIGRIVVVDQQPLGKNVRSNPATYTKLFDEIRKRFATQPRARELGLTASSFSFNTDQGCCDACQGAGVIELTMHYLPSIFQPCPQCQGRRYQGRVLEVRYQGLAIDEVLNLTITQALDLFAADVRIAGRLQILFDLGLGYLTLGQPSSTLSGGEAQRVRLASFIQEDRAKGSLYLLDEPCVGLHDQDIPCLVGALKRLRDQGAVVIAAENNPLFLAGCDWIIELSEKGVPFYSGETRGILRQRDSLVAAALAGEEPGEADDRIEPLREDAGWIRMEGVRTHNLKNVAIAIPEESFTVVSGPSGSGKSSLVFETLYKACRQRYAEQLSPFLRDRLALNGEGECDRLAPLKPAVALAARYLETTPRSTVGTLSGVHDMVRVLFSRAGGKGLHASHFSFNHHDGACPTCNGLGYVHEADASRWVVDPAKGLLSGAFSGEKSCRFFLEPRGRFMAILQGAAAKLGIDIGRSWRDLSRDALSLILDGADGTFDVTWRFERGKRSGEHRFQSQWIGLNSLILDDYQRKKDHRKRGGGYDAVVFKTICPSCQGLRLRRFVVESRVGKITLGEVLSSPLTRLREMTANDGAAFLPDGASERERLVCREIMPALTRRLESLIALGIGYLTLSRGVETLSGGEHQRLRLASLLANRLNFTLFVFDEISRGLHPLDIASLLAILRDLIAGGNTIVAVDHHPLVAAQADWTIRLGPGSGRQGGQVVYMGDEKPSPAADSEIGETAGSPAKNRVITVSSARIHNLQGLDLTIPADGLIVLCGVSGSGKSTLLHRVIHESALAGRPVHCAAVRGLDSFGAIVPFTSKNPLRCGDETIGGFLGVTGGIFKRFADATDDQARRPRLKKELTNPSAAACTYCQGRGEWTTDLDYMGSFAETCAYCRGSGLSTELNELTLHNVPLVEALTHEIESLPGELIASCRLENIISCLREFSLGYLSLGRRLRTLSTGELQRLRLANLFLNLREKPSLLLLDEPDSGLSPDECRQLIATMKRHLSQDHSAIVISHHPLLMSQADYLIELGPGAGEEGGRLTAWGAPRELMSGDWPLSKTAAYLRSFCASRSESPAHP